MKKINLFFGVVLGVFAMYSCEISTIPIEERYQNGRPSITIGQQSNALFVHFQRAVGVVQIVILDERGEDVFVETVDTDIHLLINIPTTDLLSGSYAVVISSQNNLELREEFEI